MRSKMTVKTFMLTLALTILASIAKADIYVTDVPSPVTAHEMRKAIRSGKTGYTCIKSKVSKKTGKTKAVKKAKPVFTLSTLKDLSDADDRLDNGEKLYKCNAVEVDEDTHNLVKAGDDD